ncbi:LacI family DNA-binding transcriptional regulator [Dactylosporangium sp. NPDC051484]|uniref:LacI family DNA-binding transcriptional regulator n=1 Tax=Dactylosporangium sp. NPDC051484 TaxID=3154942 RepID=UPI00344DFD09
MRDVARAAEVSVSTVANVLNNPAVVAEGTRRRVEEAMASVGFVRSGPARQLRGMPSRLVGSVTLDQANPFYAELNRGIEDRLDEAGCLVLACSTDVQADKELRILRLLEEQSPRGIIVTPTGENLAEVGAISSRGTPVVLLDAPRGALDLCAVAVDHFAGGRLAGEHLIELGHRRIAFLSASWAGGPVRERRAGLGRALAEAGLEAPVEVHIAQEGFFGGTDAAVSDLLHCTDQPSAVVCMNDIAAVAVVRALRERGLCVPDDMSVLGYDDLPFAAHVQPPLTTVRQPIREMGRVAADLLLSEGAASHRHRELVFTPELMARATTAPPRP